MSCAARWTLCEKMALSFSSNGEVTPRGWVLQLDRKKSEAAHVSPDRHEHHFSNDYELRRGIPLRSMTSRRRSTWSRRFLFALKLFGPALKSARLPRATREPPHALMQRLRCGVSPGSVPASLPIAKAPPRRFSATVSNNKR